MIVKSLKCLYCFHVPCYVTDLYLIFVVMNHRHISYLTLTCIHLILAMPCLTLEIWQRYLPCLSLDIDTSTCYAILIIWYLIAVLAMLYLLLDIWHRYLPYYTYRLLPDTWYNNIWHLTCYHPILVHLTWYCGTCIILHIHDYYFYGDLAWLLYCYQIFGTPELPVFLSPWKRVTLDIILLLIPIVG